MACSSVLETRVVAFAIALNFTTEIGTKFAPLLMVKSPPPFTAGAWGVINLMVGGENAAER